jgi:MFS family permease
MEPEKMDRPNADELEHVGNHESTPRRSHVETNDKIPVLRTSDKIPVLQTIRQNRVALGWCSYMIFTCIMYGYDGLASGIVISIPKFRMDYGYLWEGQYVVSAAWQFGFTAMFFFGMILGGIATGLLQNHIGHKGCMGGAYMISTGGVFLQWYSPGSLPMFLGGKLLTGIPVSSPPACTALQIFCSLPVVTIFRTLTIRDSSVSFSPAHQSIALK